MMNEVTVMTFEASPFDEKEALRYAGCRGEWTNDLPQSCFDELKPVISYRTVSRVYPIKQMEDKLDIGFAVTDSADLKKTLSGCTQVLVFAGTVGFGPDRLVSRYERIAPAKALLFQAIGAERIEALCDAFSERTRDVYAQQGIAVTPRFSPGYGDLPLSLQAPLLQALDAGKTCGISLTDGMLMLPTKSVTALIGLRAMPQIEKIACDRKEPEESVPSKCASCTKTDCAYRRG